MLNSLFFWLLVYYINLHKSTTPLLNRKYLQIINSLSTILFTLIYRYYNPSIISPHTYIHKQIIYYQLGYNVVDSISSIYYGKYLHFLEYFFFNFGILYNIISNRNGGFGVFSILLYEFIKPFNNINYQNKYLYYLSIIIHLCIKMIYTPYIYYKLSNKITNKTDYYFYNTNFSILSLLSLYIYSKKISKTLTM